MSVDSKIEPRESGKGQIDVADPCLLTPGPLTTSASVKQAMLHDYGSRSPSFIDLSQQICQHLLELANASDAHECVPVQGSGTFAVEAMLATLIPRHGKLLNLVNGAYGHRISEICEYIGRECVVLEAAEDVVINPNLVDEYLILDSSITHVSIIYCETTSGILNPLEEIAKVVAKHKCSLLIDAMSAFGALAFDAKNVVFDGMAASSNKCLQGVPGMGFCLVASDALEKSEGNSHSLSLDLYQQAKALKKNGQWRFTPPVHCLLALARALEELKEEGGISAREKRYSNNCQILRDGMNSLGFKTLLAEELQAPIIVTFLTPEHPRFDGEQFYEQLFAKGYVIYPGKITDADTFRIGCIGAIEEREIRGALKSIKETLLDMDVDLTS